MSIKKQKVYIVDDDVAVLDALSVLMNSAGINFEAYSSAEDFLEYFNANYSGCLLLDIRMPNMSGLQLQNVLNEKGINIPIIFVTGHGDVPMAVQAMKKGAWGFLEKPFNDEVLIGDINRAFAADAASRHVEKQRQMIANRIKQLTPRENEIMKKIVSGAHNKTIAFDLGLSQRTVELHRSHVMQKMRARSLAQLVRMSLLSEELGESE
ncbi:MAG: response regulator transcription factor [Thiotrichales bacterium]|nr:response regulator transcription factor [Thiotrichales bacterium]